MASLKQNRNLASNIILGSFAAFELVLLVLIIWGNIKCNKDDEVLMGRIKASLADPKLDNQQRIDDIVGGGIFFIHKTADDKFTMRGLKMDLKYYLIREGFRKNRTTFFEAASMIDYKDINRESTDEIRDIKFVDIESSFICKFGNIVEFKLVANMEKLYGHIIKSMQAIEIGKRIGFLLDVDSLRMATETATNTEKVMLFRLKDAVEFDENAPPLSGFMKYFCYKVFGVPEKAGSARI